MPQANTLQCRSILREAFAKTKVYCGTSWTDREHDESKHRVVTFSSGYGAEKVAETANEMFRRYGYTNRARVTGGPGSKRGEGVEYVKVNANLP